MHVLCPTNQMAASSKIFDHSSYLFTKYIPLYIPYLTFINAFHALHALHVINVIIYYIFLRLTDILAAVRADNVHYPVTQLVALENTQNYCGGKVLPIG